MAELLLYVTDEVRPDTAYQDGDIVCAFTDRRIQACHAQSIAHWKKAGQRSSGHRLDGLSRAYLDVMCEYRMERINRHEVRRVNLSTLQEDVLGPTPNADGEAIHVQEYVDHVLAIPTHRIFGTSGAEIWYSATLKHSDPLRVSAAWDVIEAETPHRRTAGEFARWPLSLAERARFLPVPTEDMREDVARRAVAPEFDTDEEQPGWTPGTPQTITRKRRAWVDWRNTGLDVSKALDRRRIYDVREAILPLGPDAAMVKPRLNVWTERAHLRPAGDPELFVGGPV